MTLKSFAEPLLERLPGSPTCHTWKLVLNLAALVWNDADKEPDEALLQLAKKVFDNFGWEDVAEEVRRLQTRRLTKFAWEPRNFAGVEVENRGDTIHVVALSMLTKG